jgi:hypothetical protein
MKQGTENAAHSNHEGLRSLYLELENFKNIDRKVVDIGGKSLIILGKNNSGKSTIIQAMTSSLNAKLQPSMPIKNGEERTKILHKIGGTLKGEYVEYTVEWFFSTKSQKGRMVVTDINGNVMKSPATMIKSLIGNVSFDVIEWLNDSKEVKLKKLKDISGCGKEIDIINIAISELKSKFKAKNDRAEELRNTLANHGMDPKEIELCQNPVDVSGIQAELSNIATAQNQWDGVNKQYEGFKTTVADAAIKINNAGTEINRLNAELLRIQNAIKDQNAIIAQQTSAADVANGNIAKAEAWFKTNPRPTIDEVNARLTLANEHNSKAARVAVLTEQFKESNQLSVDAEKIKIEIANKEKERGEIIGKSQLAIEGMSFTDEEILINGLPLEDGQINTATLFDIGVDVAIALNPNLKVIFLHDASLFDRNHLKSIIKRIEEKGYMAICEVVAENSDVECVFTENYLS